MYYKVTIKITQIINNITLYYYVSTYAVRTATAVQGFVSHTDTVSMPVSKSRCWVMVPTRHAFSCYEIVLYCVYFI